MSKVIRGDSLNDYQAWHVPEVRTDGSAQSGPMTARQLEEIQSQARREGFERGLREGRDAGQKAFNERLALLDTLLGSLDQPFQALDEAVERQLAELAMLVARQLVRRELKTEPEQVVGVVREALAALPVAARNVRVALNPEDAVLVREALAVGEDSQTIRIVDDPVQSRGGCKVLTDNSQIDASVETRLNAVIANVLGGLRAGDSGES